MRTLAIRGAWFLSAGLVIVGLASCGGGGGGGSDGGNVAGITPAPPEVTISLRSNRITTRPGEPFTLRSTIQNMSPTQPLRVSLRYFSSTDQTISIDDDEIGSEVTHDIPAGEEMTISGPDPIPPTVVGTYYYGSCVDIIDDDGVIDWVCSEGVRVLVSSTLNPGGETGRNIPMLTCDNRNDLAQAGGVALPSIDIVTIPAGTGELELRYESFSIPDRFEVKREDGTVIIDTGFVGDSHHATIGEINAFLAQAGFRSASGIFYPGSGRIVRAVTFDEDTKVEIWVYAPLRNTRWNLDFTWRCKTPLPDSGTPDLTVSVRASKTSVAPGDTFTLTATVMNIGTGNSSDASWRYFRSLDANISPTTDVAISTYDTFGALGAGFNATTAPFTVPEIATRTYYYGACVDKSAGEVNTANNCSAGVRVQVKPDLAMEVTTSATSVAIGQPVTLTAIGMNDGGDAPASMWSYRESTNSTISRSDTVIGGADRTFPELISGEEVTLPTHVVTQANPGIYYYGACVVKVSDEVRTNNNCSDSMRVVVSDPTSNPGTGGAILPPIPDLTISVSPSATSVLTGQTVTLRAVGMNTGNTGPANSPATTFRYYRSTDSDITISDTPIGVDRTFSALVAGQNVTLPSQTVMETTAATYYYGACVVAVDHELNTVNNCSDPVEVVFSDPVPDLTISAYANAHSVTTDHSIILTAIGENLGTRTVSSANWRFYRSNDATITTGDSVIGVNRFFGALSATRSRSGTYTVPPVSTAGTYYYGACIDSPTDETNTGNNCSAGVRVEVSVPLPDLTIGISTSATAVTTDPTEPRVTLTALGRNIGTGIVPSTSWRFYRSNDATITTDDTMIGFNRTVRNLSGTNDATGTYIVPVSAAGTYYYGACIDEVSGETNTRNNCSASVQVEVTPVPDLTVSVTASAASVMTGQPFTLTAEGENTGAADSPAINWRFYRSTDSRITTDDTPIGGNQTFRALTAGESVTLPTHEVTPTTAGIYYYGACIDSVSDEVNTRNNCSNGVQVISGPDLTISVTASATSVMTGQSFTLTATGGNIGTDDSPSISWRYYRGNSRFISRFDTVIGGERTFRALTAGESDVTFPSYDATQPTAGTYYYGACIDTVSGELDTRNNCSDGVPVTSGLDLTISVTPSATSVITGQHVILTATVENMGTDDSPSINWRYYQSTNDFISTSDTVIGGSRTAGAVGANGMIVLPSHTETPSIGGTYYYGACVTRVSGELNTSNNCSTSVRVVATTPPSDLTISVAASATSVTTGQDVILTATVANTESNASPAISWRYYRSTNSTISTSDTVIGGSRTSGAVPASGMVTLPSYTVTPSASGTYYYGACVTSVDGETRTNNNCSTHVEVTVTAPPPSP